MTIIKHNGESIEATAIRLIPVRHRDKDTTTDFQVDTPEGTVVFTPHIPVLFDNACIVLHSLQQVDGYFVFPDCEVSRPEAA